MLIFDVDGVLTDGKLHYGDDGSEIKSFCVQDGSAIKLLLANDIDAAIISGRSSPAVTRRAQELGIGHVYQGIHDKVSALAALEASTGIAATHMAYAGDDLPDLAVFARVGLAVAVANGHQKVRDAAALVTTAEGGSGAAAEVCELLLRAQGKWPYR